MKTSRRSAPWGAVLLSVFLQACSDESRGPIDGTWTAVSMSCPSGDLIGGAPSTNTAYANGTRVQIRAIANLGGVQTTTFFDGVANSPNACILKEELTYTYPAPGSLTQLTDKGVVTQSGTGVSGSCAAYEPAPGATPTPVPRAYQVEGATLRMIEADSPRCSSGERVTAYRRGDGSEIWVGTMTGTAVGAYICYQGGTDAYYSEVATLTLNVPAPGLIQLAAAGQGASFIGTFSNVETAHPPSGGDPSCSTAGSVASTTTAEVIVGVTLSQSGNQLQVTAPLVLLPALFQNSGFTEALDAESVTLDIAAKGSAAVSGTWSAPAPATGAVSCTGTSFVLNKR